MCDQILGLPHTADKECHLRSFVLRLSNESAVRRSWRELMGSSTGTVLIVDDDRNCSESIRAVLEREGYEVKSAERVDAAVEALSTGKFDMVFCDYRMPDKTRIDLLREVRSQRCDIPW